VEVSLTVIAVVATCFVLAESVNKLILKTSLPSVVTSLARVCEKLDNALLDTDPDPVNDPEEKSFASILVPVIFQYNVTPSIIFSVVIVVVIVSPSSTTDAEGVIVYAGNA